MPLPGKRRLRLAPSLYPPLLRSCPDEDRYLPYGQREHPRVADDVQTIHVKRPSPNFTPTKDHLHRRLLRPYENCHQPRRGVRLSTATS